MVNLIEYEDEDNMDEPVLEHSDPSQAAVNQTIETSDIETDKSKELPRVFGSDELS